MYIVHTVVLWNHTFCSEQAVGEGGGGKGGGGEWRGEGGKEEE